MELTWFGTAGFRIKTSEHTILIDPYLSRNEEAKPEQPLESKDIHDGDLIFISHGHFDHILDVPEIASKTGARIYCGNGIEDKVLHHFGSAGSTPDELERLGSQPTDILLVPLQGHTHIIQIALNYVKAFQPNVVIPHHQDSFFPPISTMVNLQPFVEGVKEIAPETEVRVLEINQTVTL